MLNKKLIVILLAISLLSFLTGCKRDTITMVVPYGSPQFAQLYMQDDENYDVTIVEGADPLVAAFGSQAYDVIFAPTNLGAKLYDSKPDYQLIASISWGSYYLASESDFTLDDLADGEIVSFGQNQTPDAILKYILDGNEIEASFDYKDSLSSVVSSFILDSSKIYLLSEPALSILGQTHALTIIDLQNEYVTLTGYESYPQASVFAFKDLTDKQINQIKEDLGSSIENLNSSKEQTATLAINLGIVMEESVILDAIPRFHIKYVDALDAKDDIIAYLELLQDFNANFIGEDLPDNTFYR
jgi:NitT/TauT family transport system substrate-binding protein